LIGSERWYENRVRNNERSSQTLRKYYSIPIAGGVLGLRSIEGVVLGRGSVTGLVGGMAPIKVL
jgi:hypothetical protein